MKKKFPRSLKVERLLGNSKTGYAFKQLDILNGTQDETYASQRGSGHYDSDRKIRTPEEEKLDDKAGPSGVENLQNSYEARDEQRVLLAITVEIEDGRVEHMEMREGDSAEEVSVKFCQDHGLPTQFVAPLTEHILKNLMSTSFEQKEVASYSQGNEMLNEANSERIWDISAVKTREEELEHFFFIHRGEGMNGCRQRTWFSKASFLQNGRVLQTLKKGFKSRNLSDRLISPTFTSMAKSRMTGQKEKRRESRRSEQLSEREKAIFMRLYTEYVKHKQRVEEEKKLSLQLYMEKIKSNKPVVSKLASQLRRQDGEVWERLWHQQPRKDHLQELRSELWEATLMECTFKPRINHHWENCSEGREMNNNHHKISRFEQLFEDAENRRRRQAEYAQWYPEGVTFRPIINKQHQLMRVDMEDQYSGRTVFDRLVLYAEKLSEKKLKLQKSRNKPVDATTGQILFKPMTGREPQFKRNTKSLPIGEFLYQMKHALDNKKHLLEERDKQQRMELANGHYVGPKSEQLLQRLKERSLRETFDYLDVDKDGFIDLVTIDTKQLTDEMAHNIVEWKKSGESIECISFQKFVELMFGIQKKTNKGAYIVLKTKKTADVDKSTFHFKMSRLSRSLASRRRRFSSNNQWYRLILLDNERKQAKVEVLRKERQNLEMAECTFKPLILTRTDKGNLKLLDGQHGSSSTHSTVEEREQQEVHGFIFQEVRDKGHDSGKAADEFLPFGLLQSLKKIMTRSIESPVQEKRIPGKEQKNSAFLSDLPET
ncbi:hypothetical protein O6H91_11G008900 [Diphasiastrum complanatum]|uniref:Uncharacterized protein n=3 Tax=Diphasiastrum complanatum TaxID=34168 RepID=A0ACC2C6A3_DIPCM|nr:hypothetical protein O6H91_11G008900 [Diphasiastrum complanatum]KAJ7537511.1 hypothetical protein O6H91_11G008900 [Diphasiastrum complanatum]KAJ7537512.1 hypothetical protein O6H91_11G008900 [Diphasiastrum complanatum]